MRTLQLHLLVPALLLVLLAPVRGQEGNGWLRILPVGDEPTFRSEVRGGVIHQLDTPEGALPPRELLVPVRKGKDKGAGRVRLKLGQMSTAVLVGVGPLTLSEGRAAEGPLQAWTKITMPARSAALAIVFRDPREKTWDSVRSIVLPDDTTSFPAGRVRLVNASPFMVSVSFQGRSTSMKPGRVMFADPTAKDAALRVAIRDAKGRSIRIYDGLISQAPGERTNVIMHWADGESPRRPARVFIRSERPIIRKLPTR